MSSGETCSCSYKVEYACMLNFKFENDLLKLVGNWNTEQIIIFRAVTYTLDVLTLVGGQISRF